jgi:hypothetical protein
MDNHQRYVEFVAARHLAYSRRLAGKWTRESEGWAPEDPIVNTRKFTNVFRLLDRGTQFVQRDLLWDRQIEDSFPDAIFRAYIYRHMNIPEPWLAFKVEFGRYPLLLDVRNGDLRRFFQHWAADGNPLFGNAYRCFVGTENKGKTRIQWVMELADLLPQRISIAAFRRASTSARNEMLQEMPRCRNFMSMQIMADLEDSPWVQGDSNGFIIPGPGAIVGAAALGVAKADVPHLIHNLRHMWASDGSITMPGTTVTPSLMDVQNTLCEFGKYVRWSALDNSKRTPYAGKNSVPQPFIPPHLRK